MRQPIPLRIFQGPTEAERERDTSRPIMLVGFQHQGNLGLGYLTSVLRQHGYSVQVVDIEQEFEEILKIAQQINPLLIGFSLIFQFFIDRYAGLLYGLRALGIDCHFTMGGHFPSLSYEQTLELVPELDSVVRFEGEPDNLNPLITQQASASYAMLGVNNSQIYELLMGYDPKDWSLTKPLLVEGEGRTSLD